MRSGSARRPAFAFRTKLLVLGYLPLVLVPLILRRFPLGTSGSWRISFNYVTGVLHVGMTAIFFWDPEMEAFRAERRRVFLTWPLVIVASTAAAMIALPPAGRDSVSVAYALWLAHHYTGQQIGVVSFILKGSALPGLASGERRFIRCTQALTTLGLIRTASYSRTPLAHVSLLPWERLAFFALAAAVLVILFRPSAVKSSIRAVSLLWALAFVAPFALLSNPLVAAAAVAAVHGFHYIYLMSFVARSARRAFSWIPLLLMGASVSAILLVLAQLRGEGLIGRAILGGYLGLVAIHYMVDAHVWRLREPFQRQYVQARFSFLGTPSPVALD